MRYYLAYGSNLSVRQMLGRCPNAVYVGTTELKGYRLLFKGSQTGSYLTVEEKARRKVPCLVWKVSGRDERALDFYEGFPKFYRKKTVEVMVHSMVEGGRGTRVEAFFYTMDERCLPGTPTEAYYETCAEGYRRFGFDGEILERAYLESTGHRRNEAARRNKERRKA